MQVESFLRHNTAFESVEVVNMWGDCGHLLLHYSIVCGLCHHLLWSSQAGGFLYHITTLGPFKRWYCCFSLIDGEGFVTWDLGRGNGVAWWCWLPCVCCVLVIMWTLIHCVCVRVSCDLCVGRGTDIEPTQHCYVNIMCLHTVSFVSLCLQSIEMCLHSITVCTCLVPSKPYFYPCVKHMPLFMEQSIASMVSVLVLCIVLYVCMYVCMYVFVYVQILWLFT